MIRLAALCLLFSTPCWAETPAANAETGFHAQRAAWNNGQLEAALSYYLDAPSMAFVNRSGVTFGLKDFAIAMRAEFATNPESMGHYAGVVLTRRDLSASSALIIVQWSITKGDRTSIGGISSQIWELRDDRWIIVFEHAS